MAVGSRPLVPSRLAPGGVIGAHGVRRSPRTVVGAYVALTKPRIIELLLVTTVPTMVLAERGWPPLGLMLVTLVGGTLAAGGANAINMYVDRDIDALMSRTQQRPLVTGVIAPRDALVFALVLEVVAFAVLWAGANLLAAVLALSATAFYVVVYTIWLKRTSRHNIVIGGAAGAVPVLVGWAAVTGSLAWAPIVLFVAMFLLDAAALLGAGDPLRRRLPRRRRADAAGRRAGGRGGPPDDRLHGRPRRRHARAGAGGRPRLDLHRHRRRGRCRLPRSTVALARRPTPAASMRVFTFSITYVTVVFGALMSTSLTCWLCRISAERDDELRPIMSRRQRAATASDAHEPHR